VISYAIPLTQDELDTILHRSSGPHEYIPVVPSVYGRAILVRGDGSALWALNQLADIRNIGKEEPQ